MPGPVDVALVSLGTTPGLRRADDAFAAALRVAGLDCDVFHVTIGAAGRLRRHPAVTVEWTVTRASAGPALRAASASTRSVTAGCRRSRPAAPMVT